MVPFSWGGIILSVCEEPPDWWEGGDEHPAIKLGLAYPRGVRFPTLPTIYTLQSIPYPPIKAVYAKGAVQNS